MVSYLLWVALVAATPAPVEVDSTRPNILFLFADDQRRDTIGALGNELIETPNLDALFESGCRFDNAYCMGSIHGAVCQPSRAMLMSGRGLYRVPMDLHDTPLLPELLGRAGYATFATGKWHNGRASLARGFERGHNLFFGGMSDHEQVPLCRMNDDGSFTKPARDGFSSELFADAAIDFLRDHAARRDPRPFFAYVAFTAPHDPRQPPAEYRHRYDPRDVPLPINYRPQHPFWNGWMTGRDETLAAWPRTADVIRDQIAEYYGLISHLDAQVGRILEALRETGQADDTVIVYTADHGLALGSHGLLGKQNLYEHSMGAPLVIRGPGVSARQSDALVYLLDLMPTLLELAGVATPTDVDGASLAPILRGTRRSVRDSLFTTYEDCQRAVRDRRYKLIRYPRIHKTQLFDLALDPHELTDLSLLDEHHQRVLAMTSLLRDWQWRTGDPHPLTAPIQESAEIDLRGRPRRPDGHQPPWIVEKYFTVDR